MAIQKCASCGKLISLSNIPEGNPVAKMNPDVFAMNFAMCENCGKWYCDRCVKKNKGKCPNCGASLKLEGPS